MKSIIAAVVAISLGILVAGCTSSGPAPVVGGDHAASAGTGVTVFGTIDAGVSGSKNR